MRISEEEFKAMQARLGSKKTRSKPRSQTEQCNTPPPNTSNAAQRKPRARQKSGEMNKTEGEYLRLFLEPKRLAGDIVLIRFEEINLRLAKRTHYRPDFYCLHADGSISFHEVKGGAGWRDDARVKFKLAAEKYREFRWFSAVKRSKKRGGWIVEEYKP